MLPISAQGRSTYKKECLVILLAVDKWGSYLQHREFIIRTDQRGLQHLGDQRLTNSIQHKAFVKLMGLQYKIQYKSSSSNALADTLSRCEPVLLAAILTCAPSWQVMAAARYHDNEEDKKLQTSLSLPTTYLGGFSLVNGLIRYKSRVWLGHNKLAQQHVLKALHSSGIGGNSGIQNTYQRVKSLFAWTKMKNYVVAYVLSCEVCQQAKAEHVKMPELLQPLPVPTQFWTVVSLDFIE
jgi:hypothetical protein